MAQAAPVVGPRGLVGGRGVGQAGLRAVAAINQSSQTVIFSGQSRQTSIIGSGDDYLIAQNWELASGRTFLASEERGGQAVCLVGETVRSKLFGSTPAI